MAETMLGSATRFDETLDLSSPERAVEVCTSAFRRSDFLTFYLCLDEPHRVQQFLRFEDYGSVLHPDAEEALLTQANPYANGFGYSEHITTSWHLFDEVMMVGARESGFLIDLRGAISVLGVESVPDDDDSVIDVSVTVEGIDGTVIFRVVEAWDGRWLIRQVIAPGGVVRSRTALWVVPEDHAGSTVTEVSTPGEPRTFYHALDLSSPEAAIETFLAAFRRGDYPTVFMILDRLAQRYAENQQLFFRFDRIIATGYPLADWLADDLPDLGEMRPDSTIWGFFSELMELAEVRSAFLIDLRGEATLAESAPGPTTVDGRPTTDVRATISGIGGTVMFRMIQAPSGRWRVLQVIVPGGNEDRAPWSVPETD